MARTHLDVEDDYEFLAEQLLITVFSDPDHYGEFDDAGVMIRETPPDSQIAGGLPRAAPAAPSPRVQIAGGLPSAAPAHVDSGSQTTRRQHLDARVSEDERLKVLRDLGMSPGGQKHGEKTWLEVAGKVKPRIDVSRQNRFAPLQNE